MRRYIFKGLSRSDQTKEILIEDAANGLACDCVCPGCKATLVAKQGTERIPHFAHYTGSSCRYGETMLHLLAKKILKAAARIKLDDERILYYTNAEVEVVEGDMRIDVVLRNNITHEKYAVEIVVTNSLSDEKIERLLRLGYNVLEIDLKGFDENISEAELSEILIEDTDCKCLFEPEPYYPGKAEKDESGLKWMMVAFMVLMVIGFVNVIKKKG
ncbi:MAG TPA: competence protein CoiA family protein [Chitinophagaceae bacterium]|nr:competence protein CoiA family protein [Chitinophagaceae bacterium]